MSQAFCHYKNTPRLNLTCRDALSYYSDFGEASSLLMRRLVDVGVIFSR